jgi:hypothetical protein
VELDLRRRLPKEQDERPRVEAEVGAELSRERATDEVYQDVLRSAREPFRVERFLEGQYDQHLVHEIADPPDAAPAPAQTWGLT